MRSGRIVASQNESTVVGAPWWGGGGLFGDQVVDYVDFRRRGILLVKRSFQCERKLKMDEFD